MIIDINHLRENLAQVKKAAQNKNIDLDLDRLLEIYDQKTTLQKEIDDLRAQRNELAASAKGSRPSPEQIEKGKALKTQIAEKEAAYRQLDDQFMELAVKVPTIPSEDTPIGKDDSENVEVERWGEPTQFDFEPQDYMTIAKDLDLIDFERGVRTSGYRGYYLKKEAVNIHMGLMMLAMEKLIAKGFLPMIPPTLVRENVLFGSGYFAGRHYDPETDEIYKIENADKEADGTVKKESKFLVGTAEPSLLAYYQGETLKEEQLPMKIAGFSQCYRSEIGSYGKDAKGIYRVHEFMKVEQVCLCPADIEQADQLHHEMVEISKELHRDLELPHRVLQICTGDMSPGKYKMFDLEAWIPSRRDYGETGSASNFVDWQARRLNVKYEAKDGTKKFVYMLNNTALATTRPLIAILENFQQADGSVRIPKTLQKYLGGQEVIEKKK